MKQKIKQILSHYHNKKINDKDLITSAVLVPLFYAQGEYHLLFTERSGELNFHQGQACFPGGIRQPSDASLVTAALREAEEEIGLVREDIEILGELDDAITVTSGCVISPFVAFIPHPYPFNINPDEVEQIFSIPLSALMDKKNFRQEYMTINGEPFPVYFYEYQGHIVWGATAYIVKQFIELLQQQGL